MQDYPWPGNVRELRNVIERAFIVVGTGQEIDTQHLLLQTASAPTGQPHAHPPAADGEGGAFILQGEPTLDEIERTYLNQLLEKYQGNRRRVASALGVSERTAYRMLERHGLK